jgi:hypothetical protein
VSLRGLGTTYLDSEFANRVAAAQQAGVVIRYTSGYRSPDEQTALLSDPNATTPAALSLHSAGLAIDVDWQHLTPDQRHSVLTAAADAGLSWGGNFKRPDPVHFYYDPGGERRRVIADFTESVARIRYR